MTRNFKVLGLTLVALLAMTALSASAASAAEFRHEGGAEKARVIANNAGEGNHVFTAGLIGSISCSTATFTGTSFVTSPQATITVSPAYSNCTFLGISNVKVNMEGCTYRFNTPTGSGPYTGSVTVLCPAGKKINFEASGCKVEVGEQTVSSVSHTNLATSPKSVTVKSNVTGITYTGSALCPGATGTHSDGTYTGSAIAKAETELGEVVGAFLE